MHPSVRLRPMQRSEVGMIAAWEREPENERFIEPWTEQRHAAALDDSDLRHLIVEGEDGVVGFALLAGLTNENSSVEFRRLVIVRKGQGYGRAAVEMVKQMCFEDLDAHRLWLDVVESNDRARSLYESAGFRVEGILRDSLKQGDEFASLVVMSILRPEFTRMEE